MKRIFNWILGVVLLPFFYGRYGFLVVFWFPLYLMNQGEIDFEIMWQMTLSISVMWSMAFWMLFGGCNVLESWTEWWMEILGVEYEYKGQWTTDMMHSFSVWTHPIIEIKGKEYKWIFARMGGNRYESDAVMNRRIIMNWLFS